MTRKRPNIGITGPDEGGFAAWLATAYAVWRAGGRPLRIRPRRPRPIDELDALIIGGGADVAPDLYGEAEQPMPADGLARSSHHWTRRAITLLLLPVLYVLRRLFSVGHTISRDDARDALETTLIEQADRRRLPLLGICRGAQLINVARGGTLHRDLADFYVESTQITTLLPYKPVVVSDGSRLLTTLGRKRARVNSLHRHAIRDPGEGLAVVAREESGVVQAIEDPQRDFLIGVQWHPEYLPQRPEQRRIFEALIGVALEARMR